MTHFLSSSSAIAISAVLAGAALIGCTSTDVVEPPAGEANAGKEISLSISAPEANGATRADTDHKLRYTAKLFQGDYIKDSFKFLERKEAIATDGESATIVFSVPEGTYSVILFADYIPSNSSPKDNGLYEDRYYDTSAENESVTMKAFTTNNGSTALDYNCINNDNYDAFAAYQVINKTEGKYETSIELSRIVSKVRVVSATDVPENTKVSSISFSDFSYIPEYSIASGHAVGHAESGKMNLWNNSLSGMSKPAENELFYFYSFADGTKDNFLEDIRFNVEFTDNSTRETFVPKGTIQVRRNYITILKGAFLAEPAPELGDIILNLSSDQNWENTINSTF